MFDKLLLAALVLACSGCVGFIADVSDNQEIRNPVPLRAEKLFGGDADRWACQPPDPSTPLTRKDFLAAWGEPAEKLVRAGGETWVYAERGRWCGALLLVLVPVPAMLPLCETYDRVEFEGDRAIRSTSRRLAASGAGIGVFPVAPVPVPFWIRPGKVTENRPLVGSVPGQDRRIDLACAPVAAGAPRATTPPADGLVNCVSGGERRWTQPANCDPS